MSEASSDGTEDDSAGAFEIDLGAGFDAVLENADKAEQLASVLEEDASLLETLNSADATEDGVIALDLDQAVADSARSILQARFVDRTDVDFEEQLIGYEDRIEDLAYILNSQTVKGDADLEVQFLNNLNELDNILGLSMDLKDEPDKMSLVYQNLDKATRIR